MLKHICPIPLYIFTISLIKLWVYKNPRLDLTLIIFMCINISSYGLGHNWERTVCKMPEYYFEATTYLIGILFIGIMII
jgi:hypothetical protein